MQRLYGGGGGGAGGAYPTTPAVPGYPPADAMALQYFWYHAYVQQSLLAQQSYLASYYSAMGQSTPALNNTSNGSSTKNNTKAPEKLDNAKYQTKSTSHKQDKQRYEPYRRQSTSAPVSPSCSTTNTVPVPLMTPLPAALVTPAYHPYTATTNNLNASATPSSAQYGAVDDVSARDEAPVDLSQKTQKLQFLSTLRELLDQQDKRNSKQRLENVNRTNDVTSQVKRDTTGSVSNPSRLPQQDASMTVPSRPVKVEPVASTASAAEATTSGQQPVASTASAADTTTTSGQRQALSSTDDKHAYIAVLRELFEKGHSRTSEQILFAAKSASGPCSAERPATPSNNNANLNTTKRIKSEFYDPRMAAVKRSHDSDVTPASESGTKRWRVNGRNELVPDSPALTARIKAEPVEEGGTTRDNDSILQDNLNEMDSGNVTMESTASTADTTADATADSLANTTADSVADVTADSTDDITTDSAADVTTDADSSASVDQSIVKTEDDKTLIQL